nr:radical SAM protein [Deltaproteobacteria bacterium]
SEQQAYLDWLRHEHDEGTPIADVLLYGMARPSLQADAHRLSRLPASWLEGFGARIRAVGLDVVVRP